MFEVKTIMTRNPVTVRRDTPISMAMQIMANQEFSGVPVVNDDMTLAGILSEKDVLELLHDIDDEQFSVEDFMTREVVVVELEDNLIDVCDLLLKTTFRRLPVLKYRKVVGIVTRKDIIRYIVNNQEFFADMMDSLLRESITV